MTTEQTISLDGMSTREMNNDVVAITFEATREGKDAAGVQKELRDAVHDALAVVQPHVVPEQVDVCTDSFQVQPRYNKNGKMDGYLGVATVTIKGTDTTTIASLASGITTMVVSSSKNSMSRKLKQSVEADLMKEAIADFTAKADAVTEAFGYKSWAISAVNVSTGTSNNSGFGGGKLMAMGASAESGTMTVESGKSTMNGQVRGSITLSRTKKA
jgi:predicted secreted protein